MDLPTTFGTANDVGPLDTTTETVEPLSATVPAVRRRLLVWFLRALVPGGPGGVTAQFVSAEQADRAIFAVETGLSNHVLAPQAINGLGEESGVGFPNIFQRDMI